MKAHARGPMVRTFELTLRVHVPNTKVLRIWVIVIVVQVLGKYRIIGYLDPWGKELQLRPKCVPFQQGSSGCAGFIQELGRGCHNRGIYSTECGSPTCL